MKLRAAFLASAWLLQASTMAAVPEPQQTAGGVLINGGVLVLSGSGTQNKLGSQRVFISNGATLRFEVSPQDNSSYPVPNDFDISHGVIDSVSGNPDFTGRVTIGRGGATFITHTKGQDMSFDGDLTGLGALRIDSQGNGGGMVRLTNDLSLMGSVTVNGPSPGFAGGEIFLGDPAALNQATLIAVAGMRGIHFDPAIPSFSLGGLSGDADIDLRGKVLSAGVVNTDLVYSGRLSDSRGRGNFIKVGSGSLTLTGQLARPPAMTVNYGTLIIAGSVNGEIKVGDPRIPLTRAVLSGTGSVGNVLLQTPGAILQPGPGGSATGILTARSLSMIPGSNLSIRIGGPSPGGVRGYDQVRASGQFSLYGNLEATIVSGFRPKPGDVFYILTTTGKAPVVGRFGNIVADELIIDGHRFRISYTADSGKNEPDSETGHDVALIAAAGG
jgi:hypothetical protein